MDQGLGARKWPKWDERWAPDARERTERDTGTGKYVRKGFGTRTIYLYTVDGSVCSHYGERVGVVVRR